MTNLDTIQTEFLSTMSRIAEFWGFPRGMGALFATLFLAPSSMTAEELGRATGLTKGAVSINLRNLLRFGMAHRTVRGGDRKDYFEAETDFWKMIRTVLEQREKPEFDEALRLVSVHVHEVSKLRAKKEEESRRALVSERLQSMESFFRALDTLVNAALAVKNLQSTLKELSPTRLLSKRRKK